MIDPRYLSLAQWTDAVNLVLAASAPVAKLHADDWKEWAYVTIATPSVAKFSPPLPEGYTDWRAWAERFVECVLL